jgi:hypothetical protein
MNFLKSTSDRDIITNRKQLETFITDFVPSYKKFSIREITDPIEISKMKPEFCGEDNETLQSVLISSRYNWKPNQYSTNQYAGLYKDNVLLAFAVYEFNQDGMAHIHLLCKCRKDSKTCSVSNIAALLIYWIIYRAQEYGQIEIGLDAFSLINIDKLMQYYTSLGFQNEVGTKTMIMDITREVVFPESIKFEMKKMGGGGKHKYKNRLYTIRTGSRGGKYILVNKNKVYI